jgi:NAD+ synthase (glutamine-hydrolysing)
MRIGLAQIDTRVGDFEGNCARIRAAARAAAEHAADLVVFPELTITGYPPRDLLFDPSFVASALDSAESLAADLSDGPPIVVGLPRPSTTTLPGHPSLNNVAAVLAHGTVTGFGPKRLLPSYNVFNETRWFLPGDRSLLLDLPKRTGLIVCEDMWDEGYPVHPSAELRAEGADLIACISASPYRPGTLQARLVNARRHALPFVFVNAVGANDELIFDGQSFALDARGDVIAMLPRFEEAVEVVDFGAPHLCDVSPWSVERELFGALSLGIRDFALKNGLRHAVVGLSGGIDSALVACLAREALGPDAVTAVAIPSRFTDRRSTDAASAIADALAIRLEIVPLEGLHAAAEATLQTLLDGPRGETAAENLQARLRMAVLATYVNRQGGLLLNTSNKTELSLGYGTLYGDMAGTLAVIGDLTKTQVYDVARWYDSGRGVIPAFVAERPPSAELRPDQVDPFDYPSVAPIVESIVRGDSTPPEATEHEVGRFRRMIRAAEAKRWQAGIVLKVSETAFGSGRMIPVTHVWGR